MRAPAAAAKPDAVARTAASVTIDLCAKEGSVTMPDGELVTIWGFALKGAAPDCNNVSVVASLPGPVLNIAQGDTVTLNVFNAIPDHTISIEAPGIDFTPPVAPDAAPNTTASLTFTASSEGTYLYESSGDSGRQEAMGLYGALIVRPTTANQAYGQTFSGGDRVVVLSEIDPGLNSNPDGYDMRNWAPRYWLINGLAYPDTNLIHVQSGTRVLFRYLNAGVDNNTLTMLGLREQLIARDAYALANPFEVVSETFPSGETTDAALNVPSAAVGTRWPLYNRNLHLTNGSFGATNFSPGGMMTFIDVVP